jgi:hypothetical protein
MYIHPPEVTGQYQQMEDIESRQESTPPTFQPKRSKVEAKARPSKPAPGHKQALNVLNIDTDVHETLNLDEESPEDASEDVWLISLPFLDGLQVSEGASDHEERDGVKISTGGTEFTFTSGPVVL